MSDYIIYNGVDSREYGVGVFFYDIDQSPEHVYERISVPGRNGDLTIDQNKYTNIQRIYDIVAYGDNYKWLNEFTGRLISNVGYFRLEDSFSSDEYYMASINGPLEIFTDRARTMSKFRLEFDRDPRKFLKAGETELYADESQYITNPTSFTAKPFIRVYGTGTLGIGATNITISYANEYTDIDCEMQDCYKGLTNCNNYVSFSNNEFPVLIAGDNYINLGNGITKAIIKPNWCMI